MEDIKPNVLTEKQLVQINTELTNRLDLASRLGSQFGGDRDLYDVFGYTKNLFYKDYVAQYSRQPIAKAIIDRPVSEAWRDGFSLVENHTDEITEFEKVFNGFYAKFDLGTILKRLDKLTCLGEYGVLLIGFNDVRRIQDMQRPVIKSDRLEVEYLKPLGEGSADIVEWEDMPGNKRFGKPRFYNITITTPSSSHTTTMKVHHSRIIHVIKDNLESEIEGTPELKSVFNQLQDLEKIVGGSAEMFYKGARPGYQALTREGYSLPSDASTEYKEQFKEFEHNLRRILTLDGIEMKGLEPQIEEPTEYVKVQLQMISADKGIPLRILTGSERGEMASTQDRNSWLETVQAWRTNHAEPDIIDKVIKALMDYGILPEIEKYTVMWPDLFSLSEKSKVEIGKNRAIALEAYIRNPMGMEVIPPPLFVKYMLGLNPDQLEEVKELLDDNQLEEIKEIAETRKQEDDENNISGKIDNSIYTPNLYT